jgi:hyperosmotically inducible protein
LLSLSLVLALSAACATARKTGSTTKDATVAAGKQVGDKTEDAAEKTTEAAKTVGAKADDATTTSAIKMKFAADNTVDASHINVDTKDGNVTLTGTVKSQAEADKAVALAKSVEGVKRVTPRLTVRKS